MKKILLMIFLLSKPLNVLADQWAMPEKREYVSKHSLYKFTVLPRNIESQGAYFVEACKGKDKPGQIANEQDVCIGILEKLVDGEYKLVWKEKLDNDVAPTDALIADSGKYVVTFNNWASIGHGDNVIVIYDESGKLKKKFALEDIMSEDELKALLNTVSSRDWGQGYYIDSDDNKLLLRLDIGLGDQMHRAIDQSPSQQLSASLEFYKNRPIRVIDLETGELMAKKDNAEGDSCNSNNDCLWINCYKYDAEAKMCYGSVEAAQKCYDGDYSPKSHYKPSCVEGKCKCVCYEGCE